MERQLNRVQNGQWQAENQAGLCDRRSHCDLQNGSEFPAAPVTGNVYARQVTQASRYSIGNF